MSLPTQYQQYIHLSRYSRWNEKEKRRETWEETVQRYIDFFVEHIKDECNYDIPPEEQKLVYDAITNLDVMPSMRAMWTAGAALKRDNIAGYNCSFIPVDRVTSFDEILYILMNGTGVGFSVERQYVSQLPVIADDFYTTSTTIVVEDSKLGWAKALKELIHLLYGGQIPNWDLSKLRPAGAKLKVFGGRSSGPLPLNDLFKFAVNIFKNAAGRKLTSLECHDLVCKIAEIVVVGGVRRSALISLSNLSDDRMRGAKSGNWWDHNVHRALSNNSAAYTEKPDMGIFMKEWLALYESKSGERGIFNRVASQRKAKENGRREWEHEFGTNPSLRKGTKVWTTEGVIPIEKLQDKTFYVRNLNGDISLAKCWLSGNNKKLYKITLQGGHEYYATKEHKWPVVTKNGVTKKETPDVKSGDYFPIIKTEKLTDGTIGTYDDGFVVGWNLGDGWITERDGGKQIGFIVNDKEKSIAEKIQKYLVENCDYSGDFTNKNEINVNNQKLRDVFDMFGVEHKSNGLPSSVWSSASEDFRKGLIDGLFSSDGHVENDSNRIVLTSSNKKLIEDVSELLGFYGIKNTVKVSSKKQYEFNGKVYDKETTRYDLNINHSGSIEHFRQLFTLSSVNKQNNILAHNQKKAMLNDRIRVVSVEETDLFEDVWDISVNDETHCFQLAHCITGNCGEIILRPFEFCNLSEVVVRWDDTVEDLERKVRVAAILGTWQSTLTKFKYINKKWQRNCEEERLLGVSLTGIMDHPVLSGKKNIDKLPSILESLKQVAIGTNAEYAQILGIPVSAAITTMKPSGTVSQLVDSASGIHARHSPYYIRTVRQDKKDPLGQFMFNSGIPSEDDVTKPEHTWVFSFPVKSPETSVFRQELSAIDQLEMWKIYRSHWCEHNPSVTISVKEHEWLEVGAWVYEHFNDVGGVSFLPYSDHVYKQAPYQDCTKDEYEALLSKIPNIDWSLLTSYENDDNTEGAGTFACAGPTGCEI